MAAFWPKEALSRVFKETDGIYAHSMSEDRLAAQGDMLEAMMKPPSDAVN
jgi:hypothetical protein